MMPSPFFGDELLNCDSPVVADRAGVTGGWAKLGMLIFDLNPTTTAPPAPNIL
jgi:hypothetical protein